MDGRSSIRIIKKPENVSFDRIHEILWAANEKNRKDGFVLSTSNLSGDQLRERIGEDGQCFVAMDGDRPVGTISVRFRKSRAWYAKGRVPDYMLAAVIPEYQGKHVGSMLSEYLFDYVKGRGFKKIELDTADTNTHAIEVYKHLGFKTVGYKANPGGDHYSVIMMKWFDKCPHSEAYCRLRYSLKRKMVRLKYTPDKKSRFSRKRVTAALKGEQRSEIRAAVEECRRLWPERPADEIKKDIENEYNTFGITPYEYVRYGFPLRNREARRDYFTDQERKEYFSKQWNLFPRNKYERYLLFADRYKREILHITFDGEDEAYADFIGRHEEFIVKPVKGVKGRGIVRLSAKDMPDLEALRNAVGGECILEEVIRQGKELADFHPQSVNTLRYVTALGDSGQAECLYALFRTGQGDSIVDNVGSGGIISLADPETGRILTDGMRGRERFETHPDSGIRFAGFQIPEWSAVCGEAKQAHETMPGQKLIGWDFAWTGNGWDMVEANPSPSFESVQVLMEKGIRPLLQKAFKELIR